MHVERSEVKTFKSKKLGNIKAKADQGIPTNSKWRRGVWSLFQVVADVWEKDGLGVPGQVWEFRFLWSFPSFPRENRSSRNVLGKRLEVPDILLPDICSLLIFALFRSGSKARPPTVATREILFATVLSPSWPELLPDLRAYRGLAHIFSGHFRPETRKRWAENPPTPLRGSSFSLCANFKVSGAKQTLVMVPSATDKLFSGGRHAAAVEWLHCPWGRSSATAKLVAAPNPSEWDFTQKKHRKKVWEFWRSTLRIFGSYY